MLRIEIFPDDVKVKTRIIAAKNDKPEREIHEQTAYAYLGGKFPVEMKLQLSDNNDPYEAGIYSIDESSFMVNNFGTLELKRFGMSIKPWKN